MAKSTRMITVNELVAESLERYASGLPPGEAEQAAILRRTASAYRQLPFQGLVHVQEEKEDVNQAAARIVRKATERD